MSNLFIALVYSSRPKLLLYYNINYYIMDVLCNVKNVTCIAHKNVICIKLSIAIPFIGTQFLNTTKISHHSTNAAYNLHVGFTFLESA